MISRSSIRYRRKKGRSYEDIARELGVSRQRIHQIAKGMNLPKVRGKTRGERKKRV